MKQITDKLSTAFYSMKSVKPFTVLETLNMVVFAYFNSAMNYGLILCGTPQPQTFLKNKIT